MVIQRWVVSAIALVLLAVALLWSGTNHDPSRSHFRPAAATATKGRIVVTNLGGTGEAPRMAIKNYSWGIKNIQSTTTGGGAGAGKAEFAPFSVEKAIDANSVALARAAANGQHFPTATVTIFEPGTTEPQSIFTLDDVAVAGTSQENRTTPLEEVSFTYRTFHWDYKAPEGDLTFCWALAENSQC